MRWTPGMFASRRPALRAPEPEPPDEAVRWRQAQREREREQDCEEAERLHALDETFQAHVREVGHYFPNDGAPYAPLAASSRRPHGLGGRISAVLDALLGLDNP